MKSLALRVWSFLRAYTDDAVVLLAVLLIARGLADVVSRPLEPIVWGLGILAVIRFGRA